MATKPIKTLAQNRQASHEYFILEKLEAGLSLVGTEVKSVRLGQLNLKDSYCSVKDGELFVYGMHISPYEKGNIFNRDPVRPRKLLVHKKEILRLYNEAKKDGVALIPLSVYLKGPLVKMELGVCKGKKLYDKRESMAKADSDREIRREFAERNRG